MTKTGLTVHSLLIAALLCSLSTVTLARDISNEQRNAYEARQVFNKKKSNHQNLLTRISQQEKRVSEEQERLSKLRDQEAAAKNELEQARINLDNKTNALNAVWDQRNQ